MHPDSDALTANHPPAPRPDWRDAEREVFRALDAVARGGLPACGDAPDDARRAGYLAEFAALLLRAPHRASLLAWADGLRTQLETRLGSASGWHPLPAVPGSLPRTPSGLDHIAQRWGISPGLNRARFLAERHALGHAAAP